MARFGSVAGIAPVLWMMLGTIIALAMPGSACGELQKTAHSARIIPVDGLPKITLIDQHGRSVSLESLKGKPLLVAFIHTQCEGPCGLITAHMKQVAKKLGSAFNSEVTMVSITTEPDEDGSRELLAYAKAQGVNADGWIFLTGAPSEIRRLLALYGVLAENDDSDHVLEIFLLNADGAAVRRYNGLATPSETIASDIRKSAPAR